MCTFLDIASALDSTNQIVILQAEIFDLRMDFDFVVGQYIKACETAVVRFDRDNLSIKLNYTGVYYQ